MKAEPINKQNLNAYLENTAGSIMTKDFISVGLGWTVGETIDYLRSNKNISDDFHDILVLNSDQKPVGTVLLSRILRSERKENISTIMNTEITKVSAETDQEDLVYEFQEKGLISATVVSNNNDVLGVVTLDNIAEIAEDEAEEDLLLMAGVGEESDIDAAPFEKAKGRFSWLLINLLTAIAASLVIKIFEADIDRLVALAVLMPIVASMAGNAGMQTLTVAIRALATKELDIENSPEMIKREIITGLINGVIFAFIVFCASYAFYSDVMLSVVFGISMILALILAALAGGLTPLILSKMGVDPAIASSVFVTTITDISAFFIFLGLASWIIL